MRARSPYGLGKMTETTCSYSQCVQKQPCITNTLSRLANMYKTIWMHPRSKQRYLIYKHHHPSCDVKITKAMRGAQYWTDHGVVRSSFSTVGNLNLLEPQLNTITLEHPDGKEEFLLLLSNHTVCSWTTDKRLN